MRRRLFTLASVLSLVLCVACAVMLVRSFRVRDSIVRGRAGGSLLAVQTSEERVTVTVAGPGFPADRATTWTLGADPEESAAWPSANLRVSQFPGLVVYRGMGTFGRSPSPAALVYPVKAVKLRWDVLLLLFAIVPGTRAVVRLRGRRTTARRTLAGHCPACGYDLRATPGRCPECGAEPEGAMA